MDSTFFRYVSVVVVIITFCFPGFALRMNVNPPTFHEGTEEVNVTCGGPTLWQNILSFQIWKVGHSKPIVTISNGKRITMENRDNMKAQGDVGSSAGENYLTLTISRPSTEHAGTYKCLVFYFDTKYQIKSEEILANATFTFEECTRGWTLHQADQTCLKAFGTHDYRHSNWVEARKSCWTLGGDLVVIKDVAKNVFVHKLIAGSTYPVWTGLRNVAASGYDFVYVDWSSMGSFHPWWGGQPDGSGSDRCVVMAKGTGVDAGFWYDTSCSSTRPYVCSKPSSMASVI